MEFFSWDEIKESLLEFWVIFATVFSKAGWFLIPTTLFVIYWIWLLGKRLKYLDSIDYVFLAITVPAENEKNPQSMEQIFAGLHGIHSDLNFVEKYWEGKIQDIISLEIVGINGHIRFLIRTPDYYRDLVEANVYAQYPDAEITEVEDYTKFAPNYFPNNKYQIFGTDFILIKKDAYPIRTYRAFADEIGKEIFIDPVAILTEVMSKLSEGEQIWIQFIVRPVGDDWKKEGEKIVSKIIGKKVEEKVSIIEKPFRALFKIVQSIVGAIGGGLGLMAEKAEAPKEDLPSIVPYLSPGEKEVAEAIDMNIAKIAFNVKFRFIYIAQKELFSKPKGVSSVVGAIKLFNTQNLNGFKSHKKVKTKVDYFKFRIPGRQRRIMRNYKLRRADRGATPFIFNIEELATVYHFPYTTVKAPTIARPEAKKAEPPIDLPVV
jgi:hypothetical protein